MKPRVIRINSKEEAKKIFKQMNVSPAGISIMAPKSVFRVLKVSNVDARAANIIKQEMLSKGGEVATPWELFKLEPSKLDILIMGTLRQFADLCIKLKQQPFGLKSLAIEIEKTLENFETSKFFIEAGRFQIDLAKKTHIMGILNITPDSFSDGGRFFDKSIAIEHAKQLIADGADILDIGGESTRPGAAPVDIDEELRRVIPVIEALASEINVPISIDTYKPEVARKAIEAGASIINDISGLRDENMISLAVEKDVPVIIMHMKGTPKDMQTNPAYDDVVKEIYEWLQAQADSAINAGLNKNKILIDPGIGFGKTFAHNLEILNRLSEFKGLGYPIILGTSRKAFIGAILDVSAEERLEGTIASVIHGAIQGANIVRVHDVKQVARACKVLDSIKNMKIE